MSRLASVACLLAGAVAAGAVTLERLSIDDLVSRSTAIIRGRVQGTEAHSRGALVYTHYAVQVVERLKGPERASWDVAVPGGITGGVRQTIAGAPQLKPGAEYILFLWTGRDGLTQILGLSQGLFLVESETGEAVASRPATSEALLDARSGQMVADQPVRLRVRDLRAKAARAVGRQGATQ